MTPLEFFLAGTMSAATVFLLAALGELVAEKSGMLNLSIEGMMAVSAAVGFVVTYQTGSHLIGFVVAGLAVDMVGQQLLVDGAWPLLHQLLGFEKLLNVDDGFLHSSFRLTN